jgi:hypothetical protein
MSVYLFRKIVFNCKQATLFIIKKSERKLSVTERFKLFYHLLFCGPCKKFAEQSLLMDEALQHFHDHLAHHPSHTLPERSKGKMQQLIDEIN